MKESYWERRIREKLSFLYPNVKLSRVIGKYVTIMTITFLTLIGLYTIWWAVLQPYFDQNRNTSSVETRVDAILDRFGKENNARLAKISADCANYSNYYEPGDNNPIAKKLTDFTNLYPISDFLCGEDSNVEKMILANGKSLYFITPVRFLECGNGGCTYYSFIEEQQGMVRRIRGFGEYWPDLESTSTQPRYYEDTDGSFFGHVSFDTTKGTVSIYHEIGECGPTNIYKVKIDGTPVLINTHDSCSKTTLFNLSNDIETNVSTIYLDQTPECPDDVTTSDRSICLYALVRKIEAKVNALEQKLVTGAPIRLKELSMVENAPRRWEYGGEPFLKDLPLAIQTAKKSKEEYLKGICFLDSMYIYGGTGMNLEEQACRYHYLRQYFTVLKRLEGGLTAISTL